MRHGAVAAGCRDNMPSSSDSPERGRASGWIPNPTASAWLHLCVRISKSTAATRDGSLTTALPSGALRSPPRDIDGSPHFRGGDVVPETGVGTSPLSILESGVEPGRKPGSGIFLGRQLPLAFPWATAWGFLLERAIGNPLCLFHRRDAAPIVRQRLFAAMRRVGEKEPYGDRYSALPPRPRSVIR